MEKEILTEKEIIGFFEKDSENIVPDPMVSKRLTYTFLVKSAQYKTTQNSFAGMFHWFFSWTNMPAKAALVSLVLFLSLINFQPSENQFFGPIQDTTLNTIPLKVDSASMLPYVADTCIFSKLSDENKNTNSPFSKSFINGIEVNTTPCSSSYNSVPQKTFPICFPTPVSFRKLQALRKLQSTAANNTIPFESPLVA